MSYKLTWEEVIRRHAEDSEVHRDLGNDPDYRPPKNQGVKEFYILTHILKGDVR